MDGKDLSLLVRTLRFLTLNSIFLAIDGTLIVMVSYSLYGLAMDGRVLLAAFLTPFSVYNLNKVTDKNEDKINRPETALKPSMRYLCPSLIAMVLGFLVSLFVSISALLIALIPVVSGLLYSIKLFPSLPRLKEIVGVKSVLVASTWATFCSLLPLSTQQTNLLKIALVFGFIFMRVFAGTILFDVLDVKGDSALGIKTIPIKLNKNRTRTLLITVNSFCVLWLIYCTIEGLFLPYMPALVSGTILGYFAIWIFFNTSYQRLLKGLIVDGEWLPIIVLMNVFTKLKF